MLSFLCCLLKKGNSQGSHFLRFIYKQSQFISWSPPHGSSVQHWLHVKKKKKKILQCHFFSPNIVQPDQSMDHPREHARAKTLVPDRSRTTAMAFPKKGVSPPEHTKLVSVGSSHRKWIFLKVSCSLCCYVKATLSYKSSVLFINIFSLTVVAICKSFVVWPHTDGLSIS